METGKGTIVVKQSIDNLIYKRKTVLFLYTTSISLPINGLFITKILQAIAFQAEISTFTIKEVKHVQDGLSEEQKSPPAIP